jgi:translocation and assembly module TamA
VIERLIDLDPGEPYRGDRLLDMQRVLQSTPYFAGVTIEIERDPAKPQRVPVRLTFIERPVADVGLSAGYGTDSGARGEVSLRYRNAFNLGFDMQSALQADKLRQIGYADFYLPAGTVAAPFVGTFATKDSVGILGEHTLIEGLDTQRVAVAGYRQFLKGPFDVRLGLSYQIEEARPEGAEKSLKRALAPNATVTWRFVDDVLDPRKGGVLQVQAAIGSKAFLSDQDFVKAYAQYQHWFTPTPQDQFIVRAELGRTFAPSREGVPEDFLYRAGGTRSVRGYKYQSLGVKEGEATVGGRYLATGTVEYVRWFNPSWGGAAFLDAGDAADTRDTLGANLGYGVGVRFRTPAGPLAFDIAYADRDRKVRAVFSVSVAF